MLALPACGHVHEESAITLPSLPAPNAQQMWSPQGSASAEMALRLHPNLHRHAKVWVTCTFLRALHPWRDARLLLQGVPLANIPLRMTMVTTDASLTSLGAVWKHRMAHGVWEPPWGEEHINVLELSAVFLALKALLPSIQGRHVLVRTDSSSKVLHVNHQGGTRSLCCLQVVQTLLF